jgi:hypothetical protein
MRKGIKNSYFFFAVLAVLKFFILLMLFLGYFVQVTATMAEMDKRVSKVELAVATLTATEQQQ